MPLFDFQCPTCGAMQIDVYQALRSAEPPACPSGCTALMEKCWSAGSSSAPFVEVTVEINGKPVVAKSMSDIRRIERDSTEAWLRGEPGAQPIIFRNFSQDRSNRDVSPIDQHFGDRVKRTRGGNPLERPELFSKTSGRRKIDIRKLSPREAEHVAREEGWIDD